MKKFISAASSYLGRVGFYFLAVVVLFALVALAQSSATFNLVLVWTTLLFAALLGIADGVYALKFLGSYLVKAFLHVALATAAFAFAFVAVSGVIEGGRTALWGVLVFAFLITAIDTVRGIIYAIQAKKANDSKAYDYLYTPKN